jgi:hypothetical protein
MEKGEKITIPAPIFQRTRPAKDENMVTLVFENGWVGTETVSGIKTMMKPINGNFPNWRFITKGIGELIPGSHPARGSETLDVIIAAKRVIMGQRNVFLEPWREKECSEKTQPNFIQVDTNLVGIYMANRRDTTSSFLIPNWAME